MRRGRAPCSSESVENSSTNEQYPRVNPLHCKSFPIPDATALAGGAVSTPFRSLSFCLDRSESI